MSQQLALDFEYRPALSREDFVVAGANRDAVAWIDHWPDWLAIGTIIVGPAACGKSHLSTVWQTRSGAARFELRGLETAQADAIVDANTTLVIEGLDRGASLEAETTLLHVINLLGERRGSLLATSRKAPVTVQFALADLASRIRAFPVLTLEEPDDALLAAVLRKHFSDRQLTAGPDVIRYLLRYGERSFAAAKRAVQRVDAAALQRKRQISVALAREILEGTD